MREPFLRSFLVSFALAAVLTPAVAFAQAATAAAATASLAKVADRLADALPDEGTVRVAVLPFADGAVPGGSRVRTDVSDALGAALARLSTVNRKIEVVTGPAVDRAALELGLAQPLSAVSAPLVGVSVYASHVIVGTVEPVEIGEPSRLTAEVIDVSRRRRIRSASADYGAPVTAIPAAARPGGPTLALSPQSSSRRAVLNTGFVASIGALAMMGMKERDLRVARNSLLDIPAGAQDQWTTEFQRAERLQHARDLWRTAAIGAAGATLVYLFVSRSGGRQNRQGLVPLPGSWALDVNPIRPGFIVARQF